MKLKKNPQSKRKINFIKIIKINVFSITTTDFHTCLWANNTHSKILAITTPSHLWTMVIPGQSRLMLKAEETQMVLGVRRAHITEPTGYYISTFALGLKLARKMICNCNYL